MHKPLTQEEVQHMAMVASCCFADYAYKASHMYSIGAIDKGDCYLLKAEILLRYTEILECYVIPQTLGPNVQPPPTSLILTEDGTDQVDGYIEQEDLYRFIQE